MNKEKLIKEIDRRLELLQGNDLPPAAAAVQWELSGLKKWIEAQEDRR